MEFNVDFEKMAELGLTLRKLREKNNFTLDIVSQRTKIGLSELSRLETGQTAKINPLKLLRLANIYKINVLDLYKMIGYVSEKDVDNYQHSEILKRELTSEIETLKTEYKQIPVFSSVAAGAGSIPDELPKTFIQLPLKDSNLKAAYINGDSMEPTLKDNGIVIFDPAATQLKNGDIGIFCLNGECFVKRYYLNDGIVILNSDNHFYPPIIVKEHDDFCICGKYIGCINL